jgi:hypothetical protein
MPCLRALHAAVVCCVMCCFVLLNVVLLNGGALHSWAHAAEPDLLLFNRDIRPILSDACFQCHGPDEQQRQGGLRLDLAEAAYAGGDSGPAVVPQQLDSSLLWQRITSSDASLRMPPAESPKQLTAEQMATLEQWIRAGAAYQGHWAFLPVERPPVPEIADAQHPIDAFIRDRLQREGLSPAPPAPRETLLRRVTLDLTGLPPTLEELDRFLADTAPGAYERAVDRLLDSPHYGERMARQWLDFARYADSNGFQTDSSRQMWGWRDWVIEAFNRNLPFDQFTIEQLAGDMLPAATRDQIIATGFNRNTRLNGEGGRIAEEWFVETVIDRVETVGLTWMALTFNCCRCHDHKFDPLSQREFYQLFAYFNSVEESGVLDSEGGGPGQGNSRPVLHIPSREQEQRLDELRAAIRSAEQQVQQLEGSSDQRQHAWERDFAQQLSSDAVVWRLIEPTAVSSAGGATLTRQPDQTWLASGENPAHDVYTITAPLAAPRFSGFLLETFPDPTLPNASLGRYPNGNFVLSDIDAVITAPGLAEPLRVEFSRAAADYEQNGYPVQAILDGKAQRRGKNTRGWAVDGPTRREPAKAMFVAAAALEVPTAATLTVTLRHEAIQQHNIGRFRISIATLPPESLTLDGAAIAESLRAAVLTDAGQRTAEQAAEIAQYFRERGDATLKQAQAAVAAATQAAKAYEESWPTVMVMQERAQPRDAFLLVRGEYDRPSDKVARGLPAVLPPLPEGAAHDRLGFARWLVSPAHPLTARVWVNRAWEHFFGAGLVRTSENFGSQAEWPSHPELLDWLAAEFMQPSYSVSDSDGNPDSRGGDGQPHGGAATGVAWDMKRLQKLIVTSATYRQSSHVTSGRDPENRWLARGPRMRLSAEAVRDQALAISGLLVPKVGGPSVRPYMPEGVWDETSRYGDLRGYKPDSGEGLYRRSMYTIWKRTAGPPTMLLFDAPSREVCTVARSRTNTPLQALALLNEVTFVEAARKLAERMLRDGGADDAQRLAFGFRLATARRPTPVELEVLARGLREDQLRFQAEPAAAVQLLQVGQTPVAADWPAEQVAAYTLAANVLLNLDEVVTRE